MGRDFIGRPDGIAHHFPLCYANPMPKHHMRCLRCKRRRYIHAKGLCPSCYNYPRMLRWKALHPHRHRMLQLRAHLQRTYNMTIEQYDELLEKQGGVCAICQTPPKKNRLSVDHDHATDRVRGLLCPTCNRFLLHMVKYADRAKDYLTLPTSARIESSEQVTAK